MQIEERFYDCYSRNVQGFGIDSSKEIKMYPSVQQSLNNIALREGYISHNIFTRLISTEGGNYQGDLYEVDVKGETSQGKKETNIFVKHIIPGQTIKDLVNVDKSYINEVFVYRELGKVFTKLQEIAHIPEEEKFKLVKSYDESSTDALLLDNLTKKGFKTLYRMDVIQIKYAELSIKQIAKFHALSFVLKHKHKEYFEKNIKTTESPLQFDEPWKSFVKRIINYSIKYFNSDVQNKIDKFRRILCEKQPKYITGDTKSIRCLCHGDFRMNNLLFKESDGGKIEVTLIDYQLIFYGSPVIDLMYLLFTSTDRVFRMTHIENLKDLYHNTLSDFLKYFDLDVNDVYPRKVFDQDWKDYLDYGLMLGFYILPFCFAVEDEVPDFSKDTIDDITFKLDDRFKDRIIEIVEEYLDLGIL